MWFVKDTVGDQTVEGEGKPKTLNQTLPNNHTKQPH